jgi:DNA polymerase-3 subunit gamma/tau
LEGVREQAAMATLDQMQRCQSILLKAEAEMAISGFTRLILEMALLKMCTLVPVVPVDEIIGRLKALESNPRKMVSTPAPIDSAPIAPVSQPKAVAVASAGEAAAVTPPSVEASYPGAAQEGWPGFVAFVNREKKRLGAILEHGRPL